MCVSPTCSGGVAAQHVNTLQNISQMAYTVERFEAHNNNYLQIRYKSSRFYEQ